MRAAWLVVLFVTACDGGDAIRLVEPTEQPVGLVGYWSEDIRGVGNHLAYALHPDGRADKEWRDEENVFQRGEPGTWKVEDGKLVVATTWTTLTSRYRLDGDVLSLGLFERSETSEGIVTFVADVHSWRVPPPPGMVSFDGEGDQIIDHTALTIYPDYRTRVNLLRGAGDCFMSLRTPPGRCEIDETGLLACTGNGDSVLRAPIDPDTGLPQLEDVPAGSLRWFRTGS